ncbi:hypothetical protein QBC38DRAFT_536963 [Podospora fimiseda]|uniref:Uncharacterized protein n=1 Tax=Podospora fimiseda TaxID=252190 RepID=A0AAN7BNP1_9PEZI|nr:hypothetical protein QBC38DRAFT_536963 [Podospora fimiseda]
MPPFISSLETRSTTTNSNSIVWIVSSIVGGVIVLVAILTTVVLYYNKRSQYQQAKELNPYLSRHEFVRKRKMSAVDLFQEEEHRRQLMIRKSIISRSSHSLHPNSPPRKEALERSETMEEVEREAAEIERQESLRLKDDWKRWEARLKHERSTSGEHHPLESPTSPGVPTLTVPSPSKHRGQSRVAFVEVGAEVLVPPPRNPNRPSMDLVSAVR